MSNFCSVVKCAQLALDNLVCETISCTTLNIYANLVELIRSHTNFPIDIFFKIIAILVIICWIQKWLQYIIQFLFKIPKIIKKIYCGKFKLCLFNECNSNILSKKNHCKKHCKKHYNKYSNSISNSISNSNSKSTKSTKSTDISE